MSLFSHWPIYSAPGTCCTSTPHSWGNSRLLRGATLHCNHICTSSVCSKSNPAPVSSLCHYLLQPVLDPPYTNTLTVSPSRQTSLDPSAAPQLSAHTPAPLHKGTSLQSSVPPPLLLSPPRQALLPQASGSSLLQPRGRRHCCKHLSSLTSSPPALLPPSFPLLPTPPLPGVSTWDSFSLAISSSHTARHTIVMLAPSFMYSLFCPQR